MAPIRTVRLAVPLALAGILLLAAGCGSKSGPDALGPAPTATTGQPSPAATGDLPKTGGPATNTTKTTSSSTSDWPSPEDCISYNPSSLTTHYEAGVWVVSNGSVAVARAYGGPSENTGQKLLALSQRYKRHCFIGRNNPRADPGPYSMDYWRDLSGQNPTIPDQEDDCSPYNRNNLTVEDMGGGDGWRVKDHDHPLHLFDNQKDALNGKLVISKYSQACSIGDGSDDKDVISYWL
jgi:hypothetical protein